MPSIVLRLGLDPLSAVLPPPPPQQHSSYISCPSRPNIVSPSSRRPSLTYQVIPHAFSGLPNPGFPFSALTTPLWPVSMSVSPGLKCPWRPRVGLSLRVFDGAEYPCSPGPKASAH